MTLIAKTLDSYANATLKWGGDDRSSTVGASEIGQCIRKIFWLKNEGDEEFGVERDAEYVDGWGARARGITYESAFWLPAMRARFGKRLLYAGTDQKTFTLNYLSATPDALITKLTPEEKSEIGTRADCALAECKTADPRTNLSEAKQENIYQAQVQLGMINIKTEWKPRHAIISYTDSSFWHDVKEFVVEYDIDVYSHAQERAQTIMTSTNFNDFPPEGWIAGGRECRYCPFTKACGIKRADLPFADESKPVDPQFEAEIVSMIRRLQEAEAKAEQGETTAKRTQVEIKNRLREKGVRKIPGVLNWTETKGRRGYNSELLRAAAVKAGVDIEEYATVGEAGDRLTILLRGERNGTP